MKNFSDLIAIYSRKSKFTGKGESVGNQIELCREYIKSHFGEKAAKKAVVFEDEGFSGGNTNRPAFKKMMEQIKNGEFKALVVYRLDRVSRNVSDFSALIEDLNQNNIVFISIREQFDTATPMGRAMMYIASVFAQLERETIAERIRDNMLELAKTGRWLGGNTPTGYCSESFKCVTINEKTKKSYKLKLVPQEAEIVKLIYDLFIKTGSLTLTESELIKQKIFTKNGNHFTRFSVKSILQNPVYMIADQEAYDYFKSKNADLFSSINDFDNCCGIMAYNRTYQKKGKTTVYKPISDWIVSVGKHKGIITGKVWVSVQDKLEQNMSKSFHRPQKNKALLTGILFCSCGSKMYPKLSKNKNCDYNIRHTYVCKLKERSKKDLCKNININGNTLDKIIVDNIKKISIEKAVFINQLEKSKYLYLSNKKENSQNFNALKKEKTDLKRKANSLLDTLADITETKAKKLIIERINQINDKINIISQNIEKTINSENKNNLNDIEIKKLCQKLITFENMFDDMTYEQKRTAIRNIVSKVVWDGENAHVFLYGSQKDNIIPKTYL